ncbi:NTP transferase domain-containing protein [Microbacterium sp. 18062]|uniref:NTP transferase domain-containing protein n=1 Tax=Microbacterium sp. 18062 TaxID=2681410 RepID=UPI0013574C4A|nr:NTP transferase domain-containing protein [Microbacterium sp. 18062]
MSRARDDAQTGRATPPVRHSYGATPHARPASEESRPAGWVVIVPLKAAAVGKSRLRESGRPGDVRQDAPHGDDDEQLVRAIGLDTVQAASAATSVTRVIVVTADAATAAAASTLAGVVVVPEPEPRGLNAAIALGAAAAGDVPRAALLGDLPALRPEDLDAALASAASVERAVVADADGTGSTLVTARTGVAWATAFGADSFARHLALGCVALDVPAGSRLRRDVDIADQLAAAASLGLGPRTSALLGTLRQGP